MFLTLQIPLKGRSCKREAERAPAIATLYPMPLLASTPAIMAASVSYLCNPTKFPFSTSRSPSTFIFLSASKPRTLGITCCLSISRQDAQSTAIRTDAAESLRVVFAAGGTGGHIYPAVAIADELKLAHPNTQILFLGAPNNMESAAIPSAGYDFVAVPSARLYRPLLSPRNLFLPYHLTKSIRASISKLRDFDPHIVIGTGGYVSFSTCLASWFMKGVKLVIQEQNSVPGIANWILSYFADVVFVAFNSTTECFPTKKKCVVCGNPVRLALRKYVPKAEALLHFFPKSGKMTDSEARVILVLGGSFGANSINITMLNLYYQMLLKSENLFIIWQTGIETFDEMESLVKNHPHLHLKPFMHSMDLAYAAADLVISRAGAMTCSEILATGKPSILIPSPNVTEGHQFRNASLLADLAGSRVIDEDDLDSATLAIAIQEILGNERTMAEMRDRALKAAKPHASTEIVQHILSLVNLPSKRETRP